MNEPLNTFGMALAIIVFFFVISYLLDLVLKHISKRFDTSASEIFVLLSNSQKALLISIGIILAIDKVGYDISTLVAGLGLSGFALGFALKDAISNLVAGIMIVLYKPFGIGDQIQIASNQGQVVDINLRYITLSTESGNCLVPNSLFLTSVLNLKSTQKE